jgi:hypothetical protein
MSGLFTGPGVEWCNKVPHFHVLWQSQLHILLARGIGCMVPEASHLPLLTTTLTAALVQAPCFKAGMALVLRRAVALALCSGGMCWHRLAAKRMVQSQRYDQRMVMHIAQQQWLLSTKHVNSSTNRQQLATVFWLRSPCCIVITCRRSKPQLHSCATDVRQGTCHRA